jgi:hypothetical protein
MRSALRYIPAAFAIVALGLAGCASGGTTSPTATPTPTPTTPACPFGDWQSTQVTASAATGGATLTLQGGSGVALTVGQDGAVQADFTGMQPIAFTGQAGGVQATGELTYSGPIRGSVPLGSGSTTASPSGTSTGTGSTPATSPSTSAGAAGAAGGSPWQPSGPVDVENLMVTVKLTAPLAATVLNNVKVSDVTGAQTTQIGSAVDLQPLLRSGQYRCDGANLVIDLSTAASAPPVTWTFARGAATPASTATPSTTPTS